MVLSHKCLIPPFSSQEAFFRLLDFQPTGSSYDTRLISPLVILGVEIMKYVCRLVRHGLSASLGVASIVVVATAARAETAGTAVEKGQKWKTVVIGDVAKYRLPAPPSPSSTAFRLDRSRTRRAVLRASGENHEEWRSGYTVNWNRIARDLVAKYKMGSLQASRVYSLLSVGQYDTLLAAHDNRSLYRRKGPSVRARPRYSYPSTAASVGSVSEEILAYLYPEEAENLRRLRRDAETTELKERRAFVSDIKAGHKLGARVARAIIARAQTDRSGGLYTGPVPTGPGMWFTAAVPPTTAILPLWGEVKPWVLTSGDQFRPAPPPAFGSPEFKAALAEVRAIADKRTAEQTRIAHFWVDGAGTSTTPGHWNEIASVSITGARLSELRTARTFALLNMAMMDASIACWDTKYAYWLLRPSQADPGIRLAVPLPDFPAYSSGHAAFSGAAASLLGYVFPQEKDGFSAMALEASMSRLYAGLHYRFDSDVGLSTGQSVADLVYKWAQAE